jgi:hypothetical protein
MTRSPPNFHGWNWKQKGWVIHYRPKHAPLSAQLEGMFRYFKLNRFEERPEFGGRKPPGRWWRPSSQPSRENCNKEVLLYTYL